MTELKCARVDAKHCRNAGSRFLLPPLPVASTAVLLGLLLAPWAMCSAQAGDQPAAGDALREPTVDAVREAVARLGGPQRPKSTV